jgi:hypothetical protein
LPRIEGKESNEAIQREARGEGHSGSNASTIDASTFEVCFDEKTSHRDDPSQVIDDLARAT